MQAMVTSNPEMAHPVMTLRRMSSSWYQDAQVLRPRPTAPTTQGVSLFGSSDEDDSGGKATVLDDDGGDPDYV